MSESRLITALNEAFDEDCEKLAQEEIHGYEASEKFDRKMKRLINNRKRAYFTFISTAGRRAACIVAAVMVLSVSTLGVKASLKSELLFDIKPGATDGSVVVTTTVYGVDNYPDKIEEEYYIPEIPKNYICDLYNSNEGGVTYTYQNIENKEQHLLFEQDIKDKYKVYYDSDDSVFYEYIDSDGQKYLIFESDEYYAFIWENGKYVFIISGYLDKEEMLDLCRSVQARSNEPYVVRKSRKSPIL